MFEFIKFLKQKLFPPSHPDPPSPPPTPPPTSIPIHPSSIPTHPSSTPPPTSTPTPSSPTDFSPLLPILLKYPASKDELLNQKSIYLKSDQISSKSPKPSSYKKGTILKQRIKIVDKPSIKSKNLILIGKPTKTPLIPEYPSSLFLKGISKKSILKNLDDIEDIYFEITLHRKLNHNFIIPHLEVLETHDYIFIVTPYEKLIDLYYYVYTDKAYISLEDDEIMYVFWELASAVFYLHSNEVFHRDLKLENILFDPTNKQIRVIDFGLSTVLDVNKIYTKTCGTLDYCAPELLKKKYTYRTEYWAMGIILFELLFGRHPFSHSQLQVNTDNPKLVHLKRIIDGEICYPPNYEQLISVHQQDLITGLIEVDPNLRLDIEEILYHPSLIYNNFVPKSFYKKLVIPSFLTGFPSNSNSFSFSSEEES